MINKALTIPPPVEGELTSDQFKRVLPKHIKVKVTPEMVKSINDVLGDQKLRENYRENLLSYTSVMMDGKHRIQCYIDAVKFVSFKLLGASNVEAYTKTFPDRFQRMVNEGMDDKQISSYVAAYNRNVLVNKIMEQTLIPVHVLNADVHQKAINQLAHLMMYADSEKVQSDSATSLLTHLKAPEVKKIELDIGLKGDKTIDELRQTTLELVEEQKRMLVSGGMNAKQVAHSTIINHTAEDLEDAEEAEIIQHEKDTRSF